MFANEQVYRFTKHAYNRACVLRVSLYLMYSETLPAKHSIGYIILNGSALGLVIARFQKRTIAPKFDRSLIGCIL